MPDFQSGFGLLGGAVQDIFGAKGHKQAAAGYDRAAGFSDEAARLSEQSGRIKQTMLARDAYRVIGGQQADVAGAGFSASGSALDLLRSSASEASLAASLTKIQSDIDTNDFIAQGDAYRSRASQERNAGKGDAFGAIIKGIAAVAAFII